MATETMVKDAEAEAQSEGERERSTILFPYGDLESAVKVAKGVHQVGGSSCQFDQLAAQLNMSPTGGGFRAVLLTAKIFGLVTYGQGTVQLTQLGQQICDPKQEKLARGNAFLFVPLYKAIYDKFKGATLPPTAALENEMTGLGVARKQTDKARQTFQRSAQQAGFFAFGQERLVFPATGGTPVDPPAPQDSSDESEDDKSKRNRGGSNGGGSGRHQLINGLITTLPNEGTEWSTADRCKWLQAAATIFDLIYKNKGPNNNLLKIEIQDSAK